MTDSDLQAVIALRIGFVPTVRAINNNGMKVSFEKYGRDASYAASRAVVEAMKPRKLKKPFSVESGDQGNFHFVVEMIFEGD